MSVLLGAHCACLLMSIRTDHRWRRGIPWQGAILFDERQIRLAGYLMYSTYVHLVVSYSPGTRGACRGRQPALGFLPPADRNRGLIETRRSSNERASTDPPSADPGTQVFLFLSCILWRHPLLLIASVVLSKYSSVVVQRGGRFAPRPSQVSLARTADPLDRCGNQLETAALVAWRVRVCWVCWVCLARLAVQTAEYIHTACTTYISDR